MHGTTNGSLHKNYQVYMRFDEWKLWRRRWFKGYESATLYDNSTALNEARGWIWMIEWTLFRTTFGKGDGYIPLFNVRGFKEFFKSRIPLYACPLVGHACSLVHCSVTHSSSIVLWLEGIGYFQDAFAWLASVLFLAIRRRATPPSRVTRVLASVLSFGNY